MPDAFFAEDGAGRTDDDAVEVFSTCRRETRVEGRRDGLHSLDDDGQRFEVEVDGIAQQLFGRASRRVVSGEIEIEVGVLCQRMHALVGSAGGVQGCLLLAEAQDGFFERRLDALGNTFVRPLGAV